MYNDDSNLPNTKQKNEFAKEKMILSKLDQKNPI